MSGRGLWIAVPQSAAGGSSQNDSSSHKGHRASSTIYGSCFGVGHIAEVTSDRTNLSPFTKDSRVQTSLLVYSIFWSSHPELTRSSLFLVHVPTLPIPNWAHIHYQLLSWPSASMFKMALFGWVAYPTVWYTHTTHHQHTLRAQLHPHTVQPIRAGGRSLTLNPCGC